MTALDLKLPIIRAAASRIRKTGKTFEDLVYFENTDGEELCYFCAPTSTLFVFGKPRNVHPDMRAEVTLWSSGGGCEG